MEQQKKIVLGFSGGLDTSYCVKYLTEEKGYEVHSILVNTGGFTAQELRQLEEHAYKLGVKSHTTINAINIISKPCTSGCCYCNSTTASIAFNGGSCCRTRIY